MTTEFDWPEFLETIIVRDTSCIHLEQREHEGNPGLAFVEKPCYRIYELITINDNSEPLRNQEPDVVTQEKKGAFASEGIGLTEHRSTATETVKAQVRTWTDMSHQSVMVRITFGTHQS